MVRPLATAVGFLLLGPTLAAEKLVLVAGGGEGPDGGKAVGAKLVSPFGVAFDGDGTIYFVEMEKGERLRAVTRDGIVRTVAGTGLKGSDGDGKPGAQASFNGMHSLAIGPQGMIYLADTWNNRIRTFDPNTGRVRAFAGDGVKGFGGDGGPAGKASFGGVYCVAFDPDRNNLFVADLDNRRVRKIDVETRAVSTVAGTGVKGRPKDGEPAKDQPLVDPRAVAVGKDGTLYILERGDHALRAVDKAGKIGTVAGTSGRAGSLVGAAALEPIEWAEAPLRRPRRDGADRRHGEPPDRRFDPKAQTVTVVAGTGSKGIAGLNGDPKEAQLNQPHGVAVQPTTGEIYICDSGNHRILKIEPPNASGGGQPPGRIPVARPCSTWRGIPPGFARRTDSTGSACRTKWRYPAGIRGEQRAEPRQLAMPRPPPRTPRRSRPARSARRTARRSAERRL